MLSSKVLPVLVALVLAGCGGGARLPPDSTKLDANVSKLALDAGSPEVALRLTDDSLAKDPNDVEALTRRGQALTDLGRLDEARGVLRKAISIAPDNAAAVLAFGRVQLPVDPAEAATYFEAALKRDGGNAAALNDLGIARDLLGQHGEAEAAYRSALAIRPEMVGTRVNLALCLAIRGQTDAAIAMLRPLAGGADATRKIKQDYAAVLAMAGKRDEAQQVLSGDMAANEIAPALDVLALAKAPGGGEVARPMPDRGSDVRAVGGT
jgi:Flp pilus assembly protein TadD